MEKRDLSIDFLRATAIFLMVITHVNALLYSGNIFVVDIFTTAGVTLCFSIFLFCSAYIHGLKIQKEKSFDLRKTVKRVLEIYLVYVICAVFVSLVLQKGISINEVLNIAFLNYVPEFTEFLIAFIVFSFIPLIFSKQIKILLEKPFILIALSLIIYFIALFIYTRISKYPFPDPIRIVLENMFGYRNQHRFPLFPYLPIYTFGLLLSKYNKNKILLKTLLISTLIFLILYIFKISHWYRWPPSPLFLMYGFIYILGVLLIYRKYKGILSKGIFKLFTRVGRYPLEQFAFSTLLVFTTKAFIKPTGNEFISIFVNLVILSTLLLYPIVSHRKMV